MSKYRYLIGAVALILSLILVPANTTFGKPYYQGKTMVIIVPHSPGGGADTFGRLMSRYLPKYIPGKPRAIVRNMPAGMTLVASNYVYFKAAKDGLTLLVGSATTSMHGFVGTKGLKANYDDMPLILTVPSAGIYYTRPEVCPKLEDFPKVVRNLVFGSPPVPYSQTVSFMLTKELFGFKTKKDVLAYNSAADARRALFAGEVDITGESIIGYMRGTLPQVKLGKVVPLWQSGLFNPEGRLVRQGGIVSDVSTLKEFYEKTHGKEPSGPVWDAYSAYVAYCRVINKPLFLPPGTEKYAVILKKAAEEMVKDPEFQKAATRVLGDAPIYTGEQATRVMSNAATRAKASRGWLREWLHKGWGLEFES
jgi:tripartite-type tricarboxylate transporter receptor subunit TctC